MFDSNLLRGEVVDLDASAMWRGMVSAASASLSCYRGYIAVHRNADSTLAGFCMRGEAFRGALNHQQRGYQATAGARAAFKERTRQERDQAEHVVKIGAARFVEGACSGDSCEACDMPLWWHIDLDVGGRLCPFGREYWTFARTLVDDSGSEGRIYWPATIRDIARATRSQNRATQP